MKITLDNADNSTRILSYGEGHIVVNEETISYPVIIDSSGYRPWSIGGIDDLNKEQVHEAILNLPEILLLGTGKNHRFPPMEVMVWLNEKRIGLEVMDTAAACRTYDVLISEGRNAAAAMLMI